jgi:hypothetical protein
VGRKGTNRTHLKNRLIAEGLKENRCETCGIAEWRGKPLSMELHHVNGNGRDNRLENLQLLCGNAMLRQIIGVVGVFVGNALNRVSRRHKTWQERLPALLGSRFA